MKNNLPSLAKLRKDYETAKSVGAPALACNAVLIPVGFEYLRLLIQNFTRPMVTNNDPADVDYAGGLAAHIQGVPKTDYETSITVIETERGTVSQFSETIVNMGGHLPECKVVFGASDGVQPAGAIVSRIYDIAVTFPDGGGEVDSASRSQILILSGSLRYMYFGEDSGLGITGLNAFNNLNSALGSGNISGVANAVGNLVNAIRT